MPRPRPAPWPCISAPRPSHRFGKPTASDSAARGAVPAGTGSAVRGDAAACPADFENRRRRHAADMKLLRVLLGLAVFFASQHGATLEHLTASLFSQKLLRS